MIYLAWLLRVEAVYQVAVQRDPAYSRAVFISRNHYMSWAAKSGGE